MSHTGTQHLPRSPLRPGRPYLLVPLEIWSDGQFHFQGGACDRLQVHRQLQLGEQVDVFVDGLAHFGHADKLPYKAMREHGGCSPADPAHLQSGPEGHMGNGQILCSGQLLPFRLTGAQRIQAQKQTYISVDVRGEHRLWVPEAKELERMEVWAPGWQDKDESYHTPISL